jgi:hypothetical protein
MSESRRTSVPLTLILILILITHGGPDRRFGTNMTLVSAIKS